MKRKIYVAIAAWTVLMSSATMVSAQDYVAPPVTISTEKVRVGGKLYYSHVVEEKQTLYSLGKAYEVSIDEIYDANPKLRETGLQKNSIILIPAPDIQASKSKKDNDRRQASNESRKFPGEEQSVAKNKQEDNNSKTKSQPQTQPQPQLQDGVTYINHTVKWFEDIESIADKYGTTPEVIMQVNGLKDRKLSSRQKLKIPKGQPAPKVEPDTRDRGKRDANRMPAYTSKNSVNAVLVMPFNADSDKPSRNTMDFYSGALLAVRDLGAGGLNIDLSVYDTGGNASPVTTERLMASDFALGPISPTEITTLLGKTPQKTYVISPLSPMAESLAAGHSNFVQAPSSSLSQYADLAKWVKEDSKPGDRIMILHESGLKNNVELDTLRSMLIKEGVYYSTFKYSILEGRDIIDSLSVKLTSDGENRMLIASESEAFVNDVIRNLNILVHNKYSVTLYGASKVRSFDTVEAEDLHNINSHISLSYYIDYESRNVTDFLKKYRALYNTEPTQFAFQGYDTMYYFCNMCSKYGDAWPQVAQLLPATKMLQSDYKLVKKGNGVVNSAVRRVVYGPNWSIKSVR